jgi:hypothetical protein
MPAEEILTSKVLPMANPPGEYGDWRLLVLAWLAFWFVAHHVLWSIWNPRRVIQITLDPTPAERFRRRLARSQVYCFFASIAGIHLLYSKCQWTPSDLLHSYTSEHELFFAMAAAHWIISFWEDLNSMDFLSGGLSTLDVRTKGSQAPRDPKQLLMRAYLVHHVVAGGGYLAVLYLRSCVGVCTFGLIFELPVLFMNHREFAVAADRTPAWFQNPTKLRNFWGVLMCVFIVARFGPTCVYI